jgi:hypothetical protein
VAKRTNYSFEKRQKETKRKKKQAEKLAKKQMRRAGSAEGEVQENPEVPAAIEGDAAARDGLP